MTARPGQGGRKEVTCVVDWLSRLPAAPSQCICSCRWTRQRYFWLCYTIAAQASLVLSGLGKPESLGDLRNGQSEAQEEKAESLVRLARSPHPARPATQQINLLAHPNLEGMVAVLSYVITNIKTTLVICI